MVAEFGAGSRACPVRLVRSRDGVALLALFGLGALVRLLFLLGTSDRTRPYSIFYYGDSRLYREFALALIRGEAFDQGIPFHPPLLAYVLSGIIRIVGENPGAMRAVLAIPSALSVPLTYLLGLRIWDRRVALVGALLAAFSFGLCVTSVSPNTEALYVPLLLAQALALVSLGDALVHGGRVRWGATEPPKHPTAQRLEMFPHSPTISAAMATIESQRNILCGN